MSKNIVVRACAECPFFQQTAGGVIASLLIHGAAKKESPLVGECGCPEESGPMHFPVGAPDVGEVAEIRSRRSRRLKILDGDSLPSRCPLYGGNVTVTVQS